MKGLIIASGNIINIENISFNLEDFDLILAVDGGVNKSKQLGIIPDLAIGDFDSITDEGKTYIEKNSIPVEKFPSRKDFTDMELGINYLVARACDNITILGGTGTRMDHTIANIFLLKNLYSKGIICNILDDTNMITYTKDVLHVEKNNFKYISVIPISEDGAVVSLIGMEYPLDKYEIDFASTIGISNELKEVRGKIVVHKGEVLVIRSND